MIKCEDCGKEIELKNRRTRCVKCTNKRNHEMAAKKRSTQEMKDYYKNYYNKKKAD